MHFHWLAVRGTLAAAILAPCSFGASRISGVALDESDMANGFYLSRSSCVLEDKQIRTLKVNRATTESYGVCSRSAGLALLLRLLPEPMRSIVGRLRAHGFTEYLNKRWLDYTGMTLDQALG